jgi:DNA polymerase III epsilon subunit-like protein
MKLALFYDTETTGLPLLKEPSEHPDQPHIVQLAACLVDLDTRNTIASMDVVVRPRGWTIPDDVAAIHGITTAHALDVGIPEEMAIDMLMAIQLEQAQLALAKFDDYKDATPNSLSWCFSPLWLAGLIGVTNEPN